MPLQQPSPAAQHVPLQHVPLQHTPLQHVCVPVQAETQVPVEGLQTSQLLALQAVARHVLPQTFVFGQHAPPRHVSFCPQVD